MVNSTGELTFCSGAINSILENYVKDLLSLKFGPLTQSPNSTIEEFDEKHVDDELYPRKLKCKNGENKSIQCKDYKHSKDQIICRGVWPHYN